MFVIRRSQEQAITVAEDARVARCVHRRIRRLHPNWCARIGEEEVRDAVSLAISKGRAYGLRTKGEFFFFLDLMVQCGVGFDTDPQFSWCRSILDDLTTRPHERLKRIRERLSTEPGNCRRDD